MFLSIFSKSLVKKKNLKVLKSLFSEVSLVSRNQKSRLASLFRKRKTHFLEDFVKPPSSLIPNIDPLTFSGPFLSFMS